MKSKLTGIIILSVILPQIALASWWNPLSWSMWNIFRSTPQTQQVHVPVLAIPVLSTGTTTTATTSIRSSTSTKIVSSTTVSTKNKEVILDKETKDICNQGVIKSADLTKKNLLSDMSTLCKSILGGQYTKDTLHLAINNLKDKWSLWNKTQELEKVTQTRATEIQVTKNESPTNTIVPINPVSLCQVDTWSCGNWDSCSISGNQIRSCIKTFDCSSVVTPSPVVSQGCKPSASAQQNTESSNSTNYQLNEDQIQYTITPLSFPEDSNSPISAKIRILTSDFDYTKIKSIYYNFYNDKTDSIFSLSKGIFDNDWNTATKEFSFSMNLDWSLLRNSRLVSIDYTVKYQNIGYSIPITNGAQLIIIPK